MTMWNTLPQMTESTERTDKTNGEAERIPVSEEVYRLRHENEDTGVTMLERSSQRLQIVVY